ncbi:MAG: prolyl oligopeptidase family serine peptidase [Tannerellaceae bacterium]|jgi:dipeptidyl aminopeptidase/acylaminoacyl peptidase|nr:prolyl oligopeptidase family serine peptidase [Tannerellaceae bacterium]
MFKRNLCIFISLLSFNFLSAEEININRFRYAGPFEIKMPFMVDCLNVKGEKYAEKELIKTALSFSPVRGSRQTVESLSQGETNTPYALHLASFYLNSDRYAKGTLCVTGEGAHEVYVNDKLQTMQGGETKLTVEPRPLEVIIKYLVKKGEEAPLNVSFKTEGDAVITAGTSPERPYTLSDVTDGRRIEWARISPNGQYVIVAMQETHPGGKQAPYTNIIDKATGNIVLSNDGRPQNMRWMPQTNRVCYTREGMQGKELVALDPVTKAESVLAVNLPDGSFTFSPTEDFLLFSIQEKGPEKDKDIQEILVPDDRQTGWRDRTFIHRYDLASGLLQRLTFGHTSTLLNDVSEDGRYILFSCREPFLSERPFSRVSVYRMDLQTMRTDTVFRHEKFITGVRFSPDGKQLLVGGSAEAFDATGLCIARGQTSNSGDGQLFLYDLPGRKVTPLTKAFDPSIDRFVWNRFDKQIYATAKDRDYVRLYSIDPVKNKIKNIPVEEEVLSDISLAAGAPCMAYWGMSVSAAQRLYTLDLKKEVSTCLRDLSQELLKDVRLGEVKDWNFVSSFGDTIYGRYYLPPHFEKGKKYPLIVNYYGGTTPTARVLESRYPAHVYAGLGYIVYILQPSGATGFGQEFSARHVNAWGKQTAEEIMEGTRRFCREHTFVNEKKVGCMGASYGGFLTMYLLTKTDMFAAAMSHAGISDITSYWGEGYWGYSYSALASAGSYPWNARDMYVNQSPLFAADKVNTPILFLHGSADTNVPPGESIQMFTALKLLGKETALIQIEGENHHILHYDKRIKWNNSIYAWFARWLKDQPEWWEALYPKKNL